MEALVDTHCHIHDSEYDFLINEVLRESRQAGIVAMVCVGTNLRSSAEAGALAAQHRDCYASLGLHPHLAINPLGDLERDFAALTRLAAKQATSGRLVAIGECGLDYHYHTDAAIRSRQRELLGWHLKLAAELELPLIFHVRAAFDDFWPIYERFKPAGVLHSFSDSPKRVEQALRYDKLRFGLNGIMTFTKDERQLKAAEVIPLERLLLETDAPYLTPAPLRGKPNRPQYLRIILDFLASRRGETPAQLAHATTANARELFGIRPDIAASPAACQLG